MIVNPVECSPYYGMTGNFKDKKPLEWQQAEGMNLTYGVPQGCVVRNTFLEWQEYEFDSSKDGEHIIIGSTDSDEYSESEGCIRLRPTRNIRRCRSCPDSLVSDNEACRRYISQPGLQRARTLPCQDSTAAKKLTADSLKAYNADDSHETSPGASGASGPLDEEDGDGSDDTPGESWSRKETREWTDQGKWNSPTSFSGRSPKSRRGDFGRDYFESKDGKGAKSRAREFDSNGKNPPNVLTLRGLPFQTSEAEVYDFIVEAGCKQWLAQISRPISLLSNPAGRPSGYAEVHLARSTDYQEVRGKLHMQYFGQRYVEVLPQKHGAPLERGSRPDRYADDRHDRDRRDKDRNRGSWRR
jgi:hypothetical protein